MYFALLSRQVHFLARSTILLAITQRCSLGFYIISSHKEKLSKQKSCIAILNLLGSTVIFAYAQPAQELFAAWLDGQQIHLLADACAGGPCPQASTPNRKYVIFSWEITGGTSIFGHSHIYIYIDIYIYIVYTYIYIDMFIYIYIIQNVLVIHPNGVYMCFFSVRLLIVDRIVHLQCTFGLPVYCNKDIPCQTCH